MKKNTFRLIFLSLVISSWPTLAFSQMSRDELAAYNDPPSRLRGVIEGFDADVGILDRFYSARTSPKRSARFKELYAGEIMLLAGIDFDMLNHDEQVDYILFNNYLEHEFKEQTRLDVCFMNLAVDGDADVLGAHRGGPPTRTRARVRWLGGAP